MDSVTQAVLGASIGGALLGRFHGRKVIVAGAVLATLPDLDVFLSYPDPITAMTSHRGFSHSVFVLSLLAVVLSVGWRRLQPDPRYGIGRLFLAFFLVLVTHPLLDAFTSYGTQLFWPATPAPASWSSIFIVDPFYTLPLLIATVCGLLAGSRPITVRWCQRALLLSSLYLAASVGAKLWAEYQVDQRAQAQGIQLERVFSSPQPFSILLWRVIGRTQDGQDCEYAIGLLDPLRENSAQESLCPPNNHFYLDVMPAAPELARLRWFTNDWLRYDVIDDLMVASDIRMGAGPGQYLFRFVVAERNMDDSWGYVPPYRWFSKQAIEPLQLAKLLLRRSLTSQPPLPLQQWAQELHASN